MSPLPDRIRRLREVLDRRQPDLTVLMERVHKPHNLAAVLRSCDAVGALEAHAVPPEEGLEISRAASAGAGKWVTVHEHADLDAAVSHLRSRGMRIVAADPGPAARPYETVDLTAPTAILLGTELDGLTPEAVAAADLRVRIPMAGMVRSLNVSVAAALLLFEAARQRREAGMYDAPRLPEEAYRRLLFEWAHPRVAERCREKGAPYPELEEDGSIPLGFDLR